MFWRAGRKGGGGDVGEKWHLLVLSDAWTLLILVEVLCVLAAQGGGERRAGGEVEFSIPLRLPDKKKKKREKLSHVCFPSHTNTLTLGDGAGESSQGYLSST